MGRGTDRYVSMLRVDCLFGCDGSMASANRLGRNINSIISSAEWEGGISVPSTEQITCDNNARCPDNSTVDKLFSERCLTKDKSFALKLFNHGEHFVF